MPAVLPAIISEYMAASERNDTAAIVACFTGRRNLFATTVLAAGHKRRRLRADEMGQYLAPFQDPGSRPHSMSCHAKSCEPRLCSARSKQACPALPGSLR